VVSVLIFNGFAPLTGTEYVCYESEVVHTDYPEPVFEATHAEPNLYALIAQYDWDVNVAYAVMMAESEGDAGAINPEWHYDRNHNPVCQGSIGLFQVACVHESVPERLLDPAYNVQTAYELWQRSGWGIWGAYKNGSYLRYTQ